MYIFRLSRTVLGHCTTFMLRFLYAFFSLSNCANLSQSQTQKCAQQLRVKFCTSSQVILC